MVFTFRLTVPPTLGTALMGLFQASILEALNKLSDQQKSLRDEIKSVTKPPSNSVVNQITVSDPKPGKSQQSDLQSNRVQNSRMNRLTHKNLDPRNTQTKGNISPCASQKIL